MLWGNLVAARRTYQQVYMGDSLTVSTGASAFPSKTYPYVSAIDLTTDGRWYYNGGVGGETSSEILTRYLALDANLKSSTLIIWAGRNNYTDPTQVKADIATMIAACGHTRYLVGSILTSTGDNVGQIAGIVTLNSELLALYGSRFADILGALQVANDGSANDLADVAAGYTPRSLRTDAVHLNDAGYAVAAGVVHGKIAALGM